MSNVFRLRYYLRRTGEKQPMLLLEPLTVPREDHTAAYFLYHANGSAEPVELRKLQALQSNSWEQLRRELLYAGLDDVDSLQDLWRGSVKKVALRDLEQGQLLAETGASFLAERSVYVLLPSVPLGGPVALCETTTEQRYQGTLKCIENFTNGLSLCHLSLGEKTLLCTKQLMDDENLLYELQADSQQENTDKWVFIFSSGVEKSLALQHFLRTRLKTRTFTELEELAAEFRGWGSADTLRSGVSFGGWSLKQELFDKHAKYIYQRACRFGGYPYNDLLRELSGELSAVMIYSLLDYFCGSERAESSTPSTPSEQEYYASCQKVGHYLLAENGMHPEARHNPEAQSNQEEDEDGLQNTGHFSPQGRKILQDLLASGTEGLPYAESEVMECLLRSAWAVYDEKAKRCYAKGHEPQRKPVQADLKTMGSMDDLLLGYKQKNERKKSSEWTLEDRSSHRASSDNRSSGNHRSYDNNRQGANHRSYDNNRSGGNYRGYDNNRSGGNHRGYDNQEPRDGSFREDRRPRQENRRDHWQADNKSGGNHRSYDNNRQGANHRSYDNNRQGANHRSYDNNRPGGNHRSYDNNRPGGNYRGSDNNRSGGNHRSYDNNKPGGNYRGSDNNRPGGNHRSYDNNRPGGNHRSYDNNKPGGNNRSYDNNRSGGNHRSYDNNRPGGNYRGYDNNRSGGNHRSYDNNRPGGNNRGYDNNKPGGNHRGYDNNRPGGNYRGSDNNRPDGNHRGYDNKRPGGNYRGYDNNKPGGNHRGSDNNRSGGNHRGYDNNRPGGNYRGSDNNRSGGNYRGYDNNKPGGNHRGSDNNKPRDGSFREYSKPQQENRGAHWQAEGDRSNGRDKSWEKKQGNRPRRPSGSARGGRFSANVNRRRDA